MTREEDMPGPFEDGEIFGTVTVRTDRKCPFGFRVQLYMSLLEISRADIISNYDGTILTMPNVSKRTFRTIVDLLSEHQSEPTFQFRARGARR